MNDFNSIFISFIQLMVIVNYDYLNTFQVALSIVVIVAIGILCGWRRLFTSAQASEIRKTLNLICIPGLIFRQIARNPLTLHTWHPFFNGILVQLTIHIIYAIICFAFPFKNKSKRFMEISCATTSADFIYYSLSLSRFIYGDTDEYEYIPAFHSLTHFFLLIPLYTLLGYVFTKTEKGSGEDAEPNYYQTTQDDDSFKSQNDGEEDEVELEEGIEIGPTAPVNPINNDNMKPSKEETLSIDNFQTKSENDQESMENIHLEEKKSSDAKSNNFDSINGIEKEYDQSDITNDEEKKVSNQNDSEVSDDVESVSLKWAIFKTYVNPITVCAVLGIIWSATGVKMITFLEETSNTLQKATLGAGLFIIGLFMYYHPFIKFNVPRVILYIFIHYFIIPGISIFWSYILKIDSTQAIINALSHVAPLGIFGSFLAQNTGYKMKCVSYTFFWSNIVFLPIFMLWILFLKEVTIFSD